MSTLLLTLLACQCGQEEPATIPPRSAEPEGDDPPSASTIAVPLSLPLDDLERILDGEIPSVLVDKEREPLEKDGKVKGELDLSVVRAGAPQLDGLPDGRVRLALPLSVEARLAKGERRAVTVAAGINVIADIDLGVASTWHLDPELELDYEWTEDPTIKVLGIRFDIRKKVDKRLRPKLTEIAEQVETTLRESGALREQMNTLWEKFGSAQVTKGEPPGWFAMHPETLFLGRLTASDDLLHLTVGLNGRVAVGLGEPPVIEPLPLPPVAPPPASQGLSVSLDVGLSWDELSELATQQAEERSEDPLIVEGVELALALADVRIYPSEGRLAIGLGYDSDGDLWSSDGTAWLLAQPVVDATSRRVRLDRFDYAVDSWDLAVQVANADLVRDGIRDAMKEQLVFDYGERLDEALAEVNTRIAAIELPGGAGVVRAHLDTVELRGVSMREEALVIRTHVTGRAEAALSAPTAPR